MDGEISARFLKISNSAEYLYGNIPGIGSASDRMGNGKAIRQNIVEGNSLKSSCYDWKMNRPRNTKWKSSFFKCWNYLKNGKNIFSKEHQKVSLNASNACIGWLINILYNWICYIYIWKVMLPFYELDHIFFVHYYSVWNEGFNFLQHNVLMYGLYRRVSPVWLHHFSKRTSLGRASPAKTYK